MTLRCRPLLCLALLLVRFAFRTLALIDATAL